MDKQTWLNTNLSWLEKQLSITLQVVTPEWMVSRMYHCTETIPHVFLHNTVQINETRYDEFVRFHAKIYHVKFIINGIAYIHPTQFISVQVKDCMPLYPPYELPKPYYTMDQSNFYKHYHP